MKTVSAKLYPTPSQELAFLRFLAIGRWVYNRALEHRIKAWNRRRESVQYSKQQAMLTGWRARMCWMRGVPATVERDALRRVDRGFKAFYRRVKAGDKPGFPRFKANDRWRSFEILQPGKYLRPDDKVFIPGIGPVKYRGLNGFVGAIKGLRVVRKERGWYVQLIVDTGQPPAQRLILRSIGVDVGLMQFAMLSTGEKISNPRWYRQAQRRLRFLQRTASRRKKGSHRRRRARSRVAILHERIASARRDWIHKLTRRLVDEYDLIAVENLNVQGMARSRFAKSVSDAAWSEFAWQLSYKAANAGAMFVRVDPRGTSQECSECGRTVSKSLSDREHVCVCGYSACRDVNAARNILRRATPESTRGERCLPERRSLNRDRIPQGV